MIIKFFLYKAMRFIAVNSGIQCVKDREGFKIMDTKEFETHGMV